MWQEEVRKNVRYNFAVNIIDAAFYGIGALGLASFVTIIPLFLNELNAPTALIGLIGSFHAIGWQLPQLFTASRVTRMRRYKPFVMWATLHERWPFIGLAIISFMLPTLGNQVAMPLTVLMVIIFSLGGGFAGTAWQSMIGKIMPKDRIGTFYGTQSGMANLFGAGSAIAAGFILERLGFPNGYTICFVIGAVALFISMGFLGSTREPEHELEVVPEKANLGWNKMLAILREDRNFRWFLLARMVSQFGIVALSFYTIYAVKHFGLAEQTAGVLTGVLLLSKTVAGPLLGWVGDRWGHRSVLVAGAVIMSAAAGLALVAPGIGWFYIIFALSGFADATLWTVTISFTQNFGTISEKPLYIGLANTLTGPITLLAPAIGGLLADGIGFGSTFTMSVMAGLAAAYLLQYVVRDPNSMAQTSGQPVVAVGD
ncbi:MAG: MFS transporter [Anaerolineae bacterium]|nr:MFS transporter [Anaerolineae bacterium]